MKMVHGCPECSRRSGKDLPRGRSYLKEEMGETAIQVEDTGIEGIWFVCHCHYQVKVLY